MIGLQNIIKYLAHLLPIGCCLSLIMLAVDEAGVLTLAIASTFALAMLFFLEKNRYHKFGFCLIFFTLLFAFVTTCKDPFALKKQLMPVLIFAGFWILANRRQTKQKTFYKIGMLACVAMVSVGPLRSINTTILSPKKPRFGENANLISRMAGLAAPIDVPNIRYPELLVKQLNFVGPIYQLSNIDENACNESDTIKAVQLTKLWTIFSLDKSYHQLLPQFKQVVRDVSDSFIQGTTSAGTGTFMVNPICHESGYLFLDLSKGDLFVQAGSAGQKYFVLPLHSGNKFYDQESGNVFSGHPLITFSTNGLSSFHVSPDARPKRAVLLFWLPAFFLAAWSAWSFLSKAAHDLVRFIKEN